MVKGTDKAQNGMARSNSANGQGYTANLGFEAKLVAKEASRGT